MNYYFKKVFLFLIFCFVHNGFSQVKPQILLPEMMGKKGVGNSDGIFINCPEINDMVTSIPKLKQYKNYNLITNFCVGPTRMLSLIYSNATNPEKKFTLILLDSRKSENENLVAEFKEDYINATYNVQNNQGIRFENSKTDYGQFGSITTVSAGVVTFKCILKDFYTLSIVIQGDQMISMNVSAVELFLKDYIAKIELSKLK